MKLTRKLISISLLAITLLPCAGAIRESISVPENLSAYTQDEPKIEDASPYHLDKLCDRIIIDAPGTPMEKLINDTSYVCKLAFKRMSYFLYDGSVPHSRFYIESLSNYKPVIYKLNHILNDIILHSTILRTLDPKTKLFEPSDVTTNNVHEGLAYVSQVLKRYEELFYRELQYTFPGQSETRDLYDLMGQTWECMWRISKLKSFTH